jgi:hypothetical protein
MATHYMKAEGGFHQRIWFAKAGRGTHQDIGISPMADQHLANGSYSFSLAAFDPRNLDVKEAAVEGKATSLYQGMGAQFGGQIWRMAHEAKVGDYIFLESENHNLHAVGVITGPYQMREGDFDETTLVKEGLHAVPVLWYPIKNGMGVIQLGRLDNAVFRNIIEKTEHVDLLFDLTRPYMANGLSNPGQTTAPTPKSQVKTTGAFGGAPASRPDPVSQPSVPAMPDSFTTPIHVARAGGFIYENIDDARLLDLIRTKAVVGTDDYFRHGMKNWMKVSQYAMMKGVSL